MAMHSHAGDGTHYPWGLPHPLLEHLAGLSGTLGQGQWNGFVTLRTVRRAVAHRGSFKGQIRAGAHPVFTPFRNLGITKEPRRNHAPY